MRLDELVTELWDGLSLIAERDFKIGQLEHRDGAGRPRPAGAGAPEPCPQRDRTDAGDRTGWCASTSPAAARRRCASPSATMAPGSRPSCASACSSASTAPTRPGRGQRRRRVGARDRAGDRRGPPRLGQGHRLTAGGAAFALDLPINWSPARGAGRGSRASGRDPQHRRRLRLLGQRLEVSYSRGSPACARCSAPPGRPAPDPLDPRQSLTSSRLNRSGLTTFRSFRTHVSATAPGRCAIGGVRVEVIGPELLSWFWMPAVAIQLRRSASSAWRLHGWALTSAVLSTRV